MNRRIDGCARAACSGTAFGESAVEPLRREAAHHVVESADVMRTARHTNCLGIPVDDFRACVTPQFKQRKFQVGDLGRNRRDVGTFNRRVARSRQQAFQVAVNSL
jgi:hypothetical protein